SEFDPTRRVGAAFAEFRVPLAGPLDSAASAHRLELTLADRMEHYSDFGVTNTLSVFGGNPDLKPEKARIWTAGLDFTPHAEPEFRASATYYDIRFTDVVTDPEFSVDLTNVLSQEAILGPSIIQRNPSAARVQQLAASPGFANLFGIDLNTIGAIFDSRVHNLSIERTRGLDLDGSWAAQTAVANFELGLNGTYIFRFDTQFTANAP